ncbi:MAG: protein kinase [Actinomycetota bacterium]
MTALSAEVARTVGGRYRPLGQVARGGQGEVLRALDEATGREVALKVRYARSPGERESLENEASLFVAMRAHPNIASFVEQFWDGNRHYLVTEWIDGSNLQSFVRDHGSPGLRPMRALDYVTQAAEALLYIHGHHPPIVHRDVKPANLIVTSTGRVVLVDFGVSQHLGSPSVARGTQGFIAPEVATGARPTQASDLYGLAATAYGLLTGETTHRGTVAWPALPAEGDEAIKTALGTALATDPSKRHTSINSFLHELTGWQKGLPPGRFAVLVASGASNDFGDAERPWLDVFDSSFEDAVESNGGTFIADAGVRDGAAAAFGSIGDALRTADVIAAAFDVEDDTSSTVTIRAAIDIARADDEPGSAILERCRLLAEAAGAGQVLASAAAVSTASEDRGQQARLVDLGVHTLPDLSPAQKVFALARRSDSGSIADPLTLDAAKHNLPVQHTSFVGRWREMAEVSQMLSRNRCLTITGAGGSGKTRLALQVAAGLASRYSDGVWFVDLASVSDAADLPDAVLTAMSLAKRPDMDARGSLLEHLAAAQPLVLLDNCEHLIEAVAEMCDEMLRAGPDVRILATGRKPLRIGAEIIWSIPSLPVPSEQLDLHEDLRRYESVRLFIDRARFRGTSEQRPEELATIARVCSRLDGLPLAIELAAAQTGSIPLDEIEDRLGKRLSGAGAPGEGHARQRTLESTIGWSHDLLTKEERILFRRLAVFEGWFDTQTAAAVCAEYDAMRTEVPELLSRLAHASLIAQDSSAFRLLETIRSFAAARLSESGELEAMNDSHTGHYLELGRRWLDATETRGWLDEVERHHADIRAALVRSLDQSETAEAGLRLATAVSPYWCRRGRPKEGVRWLGNAIAAASTADLALRARASFEQAENTWALPDPSASDMYLEAIDLASEAGDRRTEARALATYAARIADSRQEETRELGRRAVRLARTTGDPLTVAETLQLTAYIEIYFDDFAAAADLVAEGLPHALAVEDDFLITRMYASSTVARLVLHDLAGARNDGEKALFYARRSRNWAHEAAALMFLAQIVAREADWSGARAFLTEALSLALKARDRLRAILPMLTLGNIEIETQHLAEAVRWYSDVIPKAVHMTGIDNFRDEGNAILALALWGTSILALRSGRAREGARMLGAGERLYQDRKVSNQYMTYMGDTKSRLPGDLRRALGQNAYESLFDEGQTLTTAEAASEAQSLLAGAAETFRDAG